MGIYYAHPISDYNTAYEKRAEAAMKAISVAFGRWMEIENPNQDHHQLGYGQMQMAWFTEHVLPKCDGCVFSRFPGGWLGSGVLMEIEWFLINGRPVWELSEDLTTLTPVHKLPTENLLSRDETRGASRVLKALPNGGRG